MDRRLLPLRRRARAIRRAQAPRPSPTTSESSSADAPAFNLRFARQLLAGGSANILDVEGGWYATLRMPRVRTEERYAIELLDRSGACWFNQDISTISKARPT